MVGRNEIIQIRKTLAIRTVKPLWTTSVSEQGPILCHDPDYIMHILVAIMI